MGHRPLALALTASLLFLLLPGCRADPEKATSQIFAMDTIMSLTIYGTNSGSDTAQAALEAATSQIYLLQDQLSATEQNSEIYALNHAGGAWTQLSDSTVSLLTQALDLCAKTDGALDITAYPAVLAWGFPTGEYRIPNPEEREHLVNLIDYTAVEMDPQTSQGRLPDGMELDLGAVAKGYTGDLLAQLMQTYGIQSALLDLGQSSIQAIGTKPDGSPWRVGVQDPDGDNYLGVLEISDLAIGTSGGYQRFFEQDGQRYWHILDPDTAAPARSGLTSVTVVSPSGLICDGLSTALFVMGLEKGTEFWRAHPELNFDVIFISEDGSISITAGLKDAFSLAQDYESREVTVLT
ncbi:MAG: FAD:protein FMN transferase [Lawsonibacter sp.]|nr:FAD:protein FMN transferase [Lawsonibacter sp.]